MPLSRNASRISRRTEPIKRGEQLHLSAEDLLGLLDRQYVNACRGLRRGPYFRGHSAADGDPLTRARVVGYNAAGDSTAHVLLPQFLAAVAVESVEIAPHVSEEHDATRRGSDTTHDRVWCAKSPTLLAGNRVERREPSCPSGLRVRMAKAIL